MAADSSSNGDMSYDALSESHPEIYRRYKRSNPLKPGQLSDEQIEQYHRDGFLLIEDFFTDEELEAVKVDIGKLIDELADWLYEKGKIKDKYENVDIYKRLILLERECPGAHILFIKKNVFMPAFRDLATNPRLLNLLEDFLGPNISLNPIYNLRTKIPSSVATTVPWHQDNGYFEDTGYSTLIATGWIPLLSTNEVNGTLQFLRGAHKDAKVVKHSCCDGPTWYVMADIEDIEKTLGVDRVKDLVTVNVPYRGFILFNNFSPHLSLMNNSDITRWSLDLRWQRTCDSDCFWKIKPPAELRREGEPNFKPDFEEFNKVDRVKINVKDDPESEFSTSIPGPWMDKWPIVNQNEHTEKWKEMKAAKSRE